MSRTLEDQYQKKTPVEHILLRPDTYIGSVEQETQQLYTLVDSKIQMRKITYVPGLYKIFDEILVNAADNKIRDSSMSYIKVKVTGGDVNEIVIENDGKGIPIEMHKKEKVYIPELIFGHLLTSSNYDDTEKKITGGRNGYGAKLCNIFSKCFIIETQYEKKYYKQVFKNNMSEKSEPEIQRKSQRDFTRITFKPDLKRFGMDSMDEDIISLMRKRVYDLCGTVKKIRVYLDDNLLEINGFKEYTKLYFDNESNNDLELDDQEKKKVKSGLLSNSFYSYHVVNERWEIAVATSEDQFSQVSFVNSICTSKGGTHIQHILDQLIEKIIAYIKRKEKTIVLKPLQIKNQLFLFVNCLVENPAFDSQTKENLTLNPKKLGSVCSPVDKILTAIYNSPIIENIIGSAKAKQSLQLKKTDGTKTTRLTGIPKLDDANYAGTKKSNQCTLILTEGDSAKAAAVSGLAVVGRDFYGIYPLKGKILNVREASHKQIMDNKEISELKKILGLQHGKVYENTISLRYGHLMIMTDQDHDGSHIKGLLINFFDHFFPSLLKVKGFLQEFITPIIRASHKTRKKDPKIDFFTIPEFSEWYQTSPDAKNYNVKYYKGLGTSTSEDARFYFNNLSRHVKNFETITNEDRNCLDLVFSKKKADDRKEWLKNFVPGTFLDQSVTMISITDFINKEFILFSMADNIRSIPSIVDGLKPGQRKVIFGCFKKKLTGEIKVAQLTGYVSEQTNYHHGEMSMCHTIINLAQNFVGSNNINLLSPIGQFGTRILGGKDAASARYIFTSLEMLTRYIFRPEDDPILNYLTEDNQSVEPEYYVPIIPMLLVNGAEGIGTGWSTSIPNFSVYDIIHNIRRLINGEEPLEMVPYYQGFQGKIEPVQEIPKTKKSNLSNPEEQDVEIVAEPTLDVLETNKISDESSPSTQHITKFQITGSFKLDDHILEISELPIGTWTQNYKEFLESMIQEGKIKDFKEHHTENTVFFKVLGVNYKKTQIEKTFKLSTTTSLNNLVCFDSKGKIKRLKMITEIFYEFYELRMEFYCKRKEYLLKVMLEDLVMLENKVRFIKNVVDDVIILKKRKKVDIEEQLTAMNFNMISESYDYLLSMSLLSITAEKIEKLNNERETKKQAYDLLMSKTIKDLWLDDLNELEKMYEQYLKEIHGVKTKSNSGSSKKSQVTDTKRNKPNEDTNKNKDPKRKKRGTRKAWEKFDFMISDSEE